MRKINLFNRNTNLPSYRRKPVSGGFNRGGGIPLFSGMTAVIFALFIATPSFATPTELDKKTVASKAYVDTKQDKITTGLVEFDDLGTTVAVPALVLTNATGTALNGNTIGFLDSATYEGLNSGLGELPDTMVPSIGLLESFLESELGFIWDAIPPYWNALLWSVNNDNGATQTAAINAYSTTFFGHETNPWAGNSGDLINGQFLANSLALKQNKIPAGTAGNVVTYTGTAGTVGSVAVSSTEDYNQQNELTNGSNLANVQLVSTKQNKMVCAGWDSETHTDEHCWLWSIE